MITPAQGYSNHSSSSNLLKYVALCSMCCLGLCVADEVVAFVCGHLLWDVAVMSVT